MKQYIIILVLALVSYQHSHAMDKEKILVSLESLEAGLNEEVCVLCEQIKNTKCSPSQFIELFINMSEKSRDYINTLKASLQKHPLMVTDMKYYYKEQEDAYTSLVIQPEILSQIKNFSKKEKKEFMRQIKKIKKINWTNEKRFYKKQGVCMKQLSITLFLS